MKLNKKVILGSASPRRKELLAALDVDFTVEVKNTDESYDAGIPVHAVAEHIAALKAAAFTGLKDNELLITADTVVLHNGEVLGKPRNYDAAVEMLVRLGGAMHEVTTAVVLKTAEGSVRFTEVSKVYMAPISREEAEYYATHYEVMDKAGAYGVQDWIGAAKVQRIEGSYTNIMGLPTDRLYFELSNYVRAAE